MRVRGNVLGIRGGEDEKLYGNKTLSGKLDRSLASKQCILPSFNCGYLNPSTGISN